MRFHFVGQFAEDVGGFLPARAALRVFSRQARHDEELVAQGLVELHGFGQVVAEQRVEADVRAATLEADLVEEFAQGLRVAPVITGELDCLVAHFRHRRDGAVEVLRALVAHRIELKAEGNLVPAVAGFSREQSGGLDWSARGDGSDAHVFEELAS